MDWEYINKITNTIQSGLASIALLIGAMWAGWKFWLFRTVKPRLNFSVDVKSFNSNNGWIALAELKVTNKGNIKVDLREGDEQRCYLKYAIVRAPEATGKTTIISVTSDELKTIGKIFSAHRLIEPNETIDDVKIFHIPAQDAIAIQLEVQVLGKGILGKEKHKWAASGAFPLAQSASVTEFKSEDEEDVWRVVEV